MSLVVGVINIFHKQQVGQLTNALLPDLPDLTDSEVEEKQGGVAGMPKNYHCQLKDY